MESDIDYLKKVIDVKYYDDVTKNYDLLDWFIAFDLRYMSYAYTVDRKISINEDYQEHIDFLRDEYNIKTDLPTKVEYLIKYDNIIDQREHKAFFECSKNIVNRSIFNTKKQPNYSIYDNGNINIPISLIDLKEIFLNMRSRLHYYGITTDQKEIIANYLHSSVELDKDFEFKKTDHSEYRKQLESLPDSVGWFYRGNTVLTEVNLSTPDDILIEHFKNWLPKARADAEKLYNQHHKQIYNDNYANTIFDTDKIKNDRQIPRLIRRNIKNSNPKKWIEHRVLPYIDLMILISKLNISLTQTNIADILYMDLNVAREEKLRKTLFPTIQYLYGDITASFTNPARRGFYREILTKYISEFKQ